MCKTARFSTSEKYDYYFKKLAESKEKGAYASIDFGPSDLKFRLFKNEPTQFTKTQQADEDPFTTAMNTGVPANAEKDDDLPW